MNIERQICSLEYSKRLDDLGIKQQSLFYWEFISSGYQIKYLPFRFSEKGFEENTNYYSAFTVAELGEMLPAGVCQTDKQNIDRFPEFKKYTIYLAASYGSTFKEDDKEADARAKMLIYLIEKNLVKVEDINNDR